MSPVRSCASRESEKDISNRVRGRLSFCQKLKPEFQSNLVSKISKALLIISIICYASFSFAAGDRPRAKKYRPRLAGNCETGERFAPSLENLFLPDDEVDDNYSFDEWSLKYIYPLNKSASVNLKHRMAWKDYADKDSFDSTANYYTVGFNQRLNPLLKLCLEIELQDRDYVNDFHKNYRTMGGSAQLRIKPPDGISSYELGCSLREREYLESGERDFNITSFFLRWKAELFEDFVLKAKYKTKYRHYEVDSTPQKDRFKHSLGLGFELWF